jgi:hypothetical protein
LLFYLLHNKNHSVLSKQGVPIVIISILGPSLQLAYCQCEQSLAGLLCPAYARCERGGCPRYGGEIWCPHIQRHRLYAFLKELSGPSFFSRHHRLAYPPADDLFLRSLLKGSLAFTRPLFTRGRFRFVAKLSLRHYSWLRTLPLPGTHAGVDDRLGHEPGVVFDYPLKVCDLHIAQGPRKTSPIAV